MSSENGYRVPDVVGAVLGYRAWTVLGEGRGTRLASVTALNSKEPIMTLHAIWPPSRWTVAICPNNAAHNPTVPVEDCGCGLYSARSREQLVQLGYGVYGEVPDKVIGEIAMSGKVIPGSQGWRAEKARVTRLWVPYERPEWARVLGEVYGVPVELANLFGSEGR